MDQIKQEAPWSEIIQRLDLIVALLLERTDPRSTFTMTDKIAKLSGLGASPSTISKILQKPLNYVTASTSMRRKAKRHD
jgi:hypothetical protein